METKTSTVVIGMISIYFLLLFPSFLVTGSFLHLFKLSNDNSSIFLITRIFCWVCLLLAWLYAVKIEKRPLLLWQEKNYSFGFYIISFIGIFIAFFLSMFVIQAALLLTGAHEQKSIRLQELLTMLRSNNFLLIFTTITAGVTEELLFRGYLQPRLQSVFKNPWAAIIISSLLFGAVHWRFGTIFNIAGPVLIGIISSFYYWKFRNIKVLIVCHFLWDLMGLCILLNQHKN